MFGMKPYVRLLRQPSYHWRMERKETKYNAIHVCNWSEAMTFERHTFSTDQQLLSWMIQQPCRNVKKYVQKPVALSSEGSSGAWLHPLKLYGWKEGDPQQQCTCNLKQGEHSNKLSSFCHNVMTCANVHLLFNAGSFMTMGTWPNAISRSEGLPDYISLWLGIMNQFCDPSTVFKIPSDETVTSNAKGKPQRTFKTLPLLKKRGTIGKPQVPFSKPTPWCRLRCRWGPTEMLRREEPRWSPGAVKRTGVAPVQGPSKDAMWKQGTSVCQYPSPTKSYIIWGLSKIPVTFWYVRTPCASPLRALARVRISAYPIHRMQNSRDFCMLQSKSNFLCKPQQKCEEFCGSGLAPRCHWRKCYYQTQIYEESGL